jgi:serine/threonine protein kinase
MLFFCAPWRGPLRAVPGSALLFISGTPASVLRRESDQLEQGLKGSREASQSAAPALSPSVPDARSDDGLQTTSDYQLLHLAGRGAYGSVWVARDRTGILLALKIIEPAHLPGADHGEREERALALVRQRVPHYPHLVSISHVSRQEGRLLYAMELADPAAGSPPPDQDGYQADTLARRVAASGRLPLPDAIRVALSLLSALEALHDAGLVHRDVKPGNVIFVGGAPKLADIGLATAVETHMSLAGTAGYVPLDGSTGPDADLYALGKLLYQLVTGCEPADFPAVPAPLLTGPERKAFRRLNRVLLRACAPTRAERYGSAAELRAALEAVQAPRRGRLSTTMWASALFVLAVVGLWSGRHWISPRMDEPPLHSDQPAVDQPPSPSLSAAAAPPLAVDFVRTVAALQPHDQVRAVADELNRRNPSFDGVLKPVVRDGKNVAVSLSSLHVTDLSPLRALPDLESLDCSSPTDHQWGPLADLSPLRGMKLTRLRFAWNRVTDLSPLAGMPLEVFDCSGNSIESLEPLRDLPLHTLLCHINQIKDLSPLADLPLTTLNCGANPVEDWTPLARLPLRQLFINYSSFHDFSVLKAGRLEFVRCEHSRVADLGPLAGMPLVYLDCGDCKVASLEPLRKTPLRFLGIRQTEVTDLSPLAGLRLEEVGLTGSKVRDLTPLRGMPIRFIELDFDPQRDGPVLRSLPRLRLVNRRPVADLLR